ncbi:MAG: phosphoribosylformimino-5-aminoimidazole carboxamide ribotide isomerase [Clostridium sp.]|jgi:phosphoribosylformimino-5-aminoimidazole carboxamide ribotide isomerase|nr:phosphoribosylformimino-5-aminoimidazole carboxamide ribotide isomerase [Clostridium sp.]
MEFRPCIDIHNGKVKQIIGSSLQEEASKVLENFVSQQDAAFYARLYAEKGIKGGHVILLNPERSEYYQATRAQALSALSAYPGGLQAGGGIHPGNAAEYLDAGASHVIVTSYVFRDGRIRFDHLEELVREVGKERLVLDVSCRRTGEGYRVMTDRWQKMSGERISCGLLDGLSAYCGEFLIHAVDAEGRAEGIELELVKLLGEWGKIPVTYAGGVRGLEDIRTLRELGKNRLHVTVGSALDLFGGTLSMEQILRYIHQFD